jgi:hypothetical protein
MIYSTWKCLAAAADWVPSVLLYNIHERPKNKWRSPVKKRIKESSRRLDDLLKIIFHLLYCILVDMYIYTDGIYILI